MSSVDRVREFFTQRGIEILIQELSSSTRTAQLAADAVGAPLGSIVKSLVFIAGDKTVLALVAGDQSADPEKIARALSEPNARIANANEVRQHTGFVIGGVPPVAHAAALATLFDKSLLRFQKVWAAAGTPNAVFEIEAEKLLALTQGQVSDIISNEGTEGMMRR